VDPFNESEIENKEKEVIADDQEKNEINDVKPEIRTDKEVPKGAVYKTFFKKKTILNEEHFYQDHNQNHPSTETFINNFKRGIRFKRKSALEFQLDNIKYKFKILFFAS
jgi:hypothetical protein